MPMPPGIITVIGLTPQSIDAEVAGAAQAAEANAIAHTNQLVNDLSDDQTESINELKALIETITPSTHTHWWGHGKVLAGGSFVLDKNSEPPFYYRGFQNPANINDEVEFEFALKAGTYKVVLIGTRQANLGIVQVFVDNVVIGNIDLFYPQVAGIASFVTLNFDIAVSGMHKFKTKIVGKNSSSEGYYLVLSSVIISPR